MKRVCVWGLAILFGLGAIAAFADHPYSASRGRADTKSYYNERQTREGSGYRPTTRPERYSTERYEFDYYYDRYRWDDGPLYGVPAYIWRRPTLFEYEPTLFGRDSLSPWARTLRPELDIVPIVTPYWGYYEYVRPPYGCAYGYRYRHGCGSGLTLRFGGDDGGLVIIIRP